MTIVWSRAALRDLNGIAAYLAHDNPDMVEPVIARITLSVARYSRFPQLGRMGPLAGTREIVVPSLPYLVLYQVQGNTFEIIRIRHTAQKSY